MKNSANYGHQPLTLRYLLQILDATAALMQHSSEVAGGGRSKSEVVRVVVGGVMGMSVAVIISHDVIGSRSVCGKSREEK